MPKFPADIVPSKCSNCGSRDTHDYIHEGGGYAFSTCNHCGEDFDDPAKEEEDEDDDE